MALLSAFLDESDNTYPGGGSRVLAIGGYVAFPHHFAGLAPQWQTIVSERLEPLGIERFHMTAFESHSEGFEKLSNVDSKRLLRDLIDVIHSCEIQPVAAVMDLRDWDALPQYMRSDLVSPYVPLWQAIISDIAKSITTSDGDPRIQFTFDLRSDVTSECKRAYGQMRSRYPQLTTTPPVFAFNAFVPELQAADIFAYDTCKHVRNRLAGDQRTRYTTMALREKRIPWIKQVKIMEGDRWGFVDA